MFFFNLYSTLDYTNSLLFIASRDHDNSVVSNRLFVTKGRHNSLCELYKLCLWAAVAMLKVTRFLSGHHEKPNFATVLCGQMPQHLRSLSEAIRGPRPPQLIVTKSQNI